jgi:hypothetical protein
MRASQEPGAEPIEILPLVIVTQAFPARPSALPDVRDFVRRRLTRTPLPEDDVRNLCDRVADVLLDAAGGGGAIQVSLRIFPAYAEVDVLFSGGETPGGDEPLGGDESPGGDEAAHAEGIGASRRAGDGGQAGPSSLAGAPNDASPAGADAVVSVRAASATFAGWLSAALRRDGLTMEAASRRLGVSAKTVSRWISGTTEPRLRDLSRIRDVFGDPPIP